MCGPSSDPEPVTTWTRSGGRPASSSSAKPHSAVNGVWPSGLITTALPAASAGVAPLLAGLELDEVERLVLAREHEVVEAEEDAAALGEASPCPLGLRLASA